MLKLLFVIWLLVIKRKIYRGNLKYFLDEYCKLRNGDFQVSGEDLGDLDELNAAIAAGIEVFGVKQFSRRFLSAEDKFDRPFNRAAFDVLSASLVEPNVRDQAQSDPERFVGVWKTACGNARFSRAIETTTKSIDSTRDRFSIWFDLIRRNFNVDIPLPKIEDARNDA